MFQSYCELQSMRLTIFFNYGIFFFDSIAEHELEGRAFLEKAFVELI